MTSSRADDALPAHLRVYGIMVPVSDLDRSLAFYTGSLAFTLIQELTFPQGIRGAAVSPPDGTTILVLMQADPEHRIGTPSSAWFVTDDIAARYRDWRERGVRFTAEPQSTGLAASHTMFLDPDGNGFRLVEADALTRDIEAERRAIADRLEMERRAAHELRIATQVQAGLLPQRRPAMPTLECAGVCIQARQVGGDYFDFLDFDRRQLGIVVGDVSGKGIGAALLMANLQAHIRSHYALHARDLPALLSSVNRSFFESTPPASYASLFLATYDAATRRLLFVNCGHPAPMLVRAGGAIDTLEATSPVLGMFDEWTGVCAEVQLADGDVLAIYTDGVTEALGEDEEDFGTARLADALRATSHLGAQAQLDHVVAAVQQFSRGTQFDDITLLIARCTGG